MSFFDIITHSMTTIATGGFSNYNQSIGYFNNFYIELVSIIFILVVHNIFHFLKNTLTVPKAKDLVDVHMEKYKHIYATLNNNEPILNYSGSLTPENTEGTTNIDDIPMMSNDLNKQPKINPLLNQSENHNMKNELKNFNIAR